MGQEDQRLTVQNDSRLRTLRHLRRVGHAAQVELAHAIGLTKGTTSQLIGDLLRQGILREDTPASIGRGRPRVRLTINKDAACSIGFFPMRDGTAFVEFLNLEGGSVFSQQVAFAFPDLDRLVDLLGDTLEGVMERAPVARSMVRAIGVVLPAHLDRDRGAIHWMPPHRQNGPLPVSAPLQARLGIPVCLENRATVMARGEHWFGRPETADNFTMIALMDAGMGAAFYVNGRLNSGFHGMNSEFGHTKVAFEGGRRCYCGGYGCLAAYVTVPAMIGALAESRGQDQPLPGNYAVAFREVLGDARSGRGDALAIIGRAGRALGTAIAGHINERDPGRVVVASMYEDFISLLEPIVRATVQDQTLATLASRTVLAFRGASPGDFMQGTAALALERLYRSL